MRPEVPVEPEPQQARDVVAFGHEVGRALSDGRIVGRAEPFAKVFPSSRPVKRAVGVTAWVVLEDIALDASLDVEGRLVAETNVRRIAANLDLARNTVARHLARLREHGFVLHEEVRDGAAGRFETARYVLDPSAALERFTVTPTSNDEGDGGSADVPERVGFDGDVPCRNSCDTGVGACRSSCDAVPCPRFCDTGEDAEILPNSAMSQFSRHRGLRHNSRTVAVVQQQQSFSASGRERDVDRPAFEGLLGRLTALGVDRHTAHSLLGDYPGERVRDAVDAVAGADAAKPAGWVVAAIRGGWDIADMAAEQRRLAARQQRGEAEAAEREHDAKRARRRQQRTAGWLAAAVGVLDEEQLATAIAVLTDPVPGLGRRALPEVKQRLAGWAAAMHLAGPDLPLDEALPAAVAEADGFDPARMPAEMPAPPDLPGPAPADAGRRLRAVLAAIDDEPSPPPATEEVEK